jgi:hypothetical protein
VRGPCYADGRHFGVEVVMAMAHLRSGALANRKRPIMIELDGHLIKSHVLASEAEQPAEVSIKIREKGWLPYRVRFDESQAAWIVSSLYLLRA